MKLNIGNKILMLLHWLCSLMICVAFALCLIVPGLQSNLISRAEGSMGAVGSKIAGAVLLALYLALSVATFLLLIRRRRHIERGFISVASDDKGHVRIAVSAVEQMVRQSVRSIDGITDMKVNIEGADDAIIIGVVATIASGAHVPTITTNMKRAITQFVEVNCGVAVQSVDVTINAVSGKGDASRRRLLGRGKPPAEAPAYEPSTPAVNDPIETELSEADEAPAASTWQKAPTQEAAEAEAPDSQADETAPAEEAPRAQAPAFDPDKPYVSEFARDYEAMKARERAGEAGDADTPEE